MNYTATSIIKKITLNKEAQCIVRAQKIEAANLQGFGSREFFSVV